MVDQVDPITGVMRDVRRQAQASWRDIATAPTDSTPVLLGRYGFIPSTGYRISHDSKWKIPGTGANVIFNPTHWKPLDASPANSSSSIEDSALDITPIKDRLAAATPGPWGSCRDGGCKCTIVHCRDYPVANVTKGKWGDQYASLRLVGGSLDLKVEPYTAMIEYGEVEESQAMANRTFIRESPSDIAALIAEVERLRAASGQ